MNSILAITTWRRRNWRFWLWGTVLCLGVYGCATMDASEEHFGYLRPAVVSTALSMKGRPYRYGGSTPAGFDCSGLIQYSFRKVGVPVPRTSYAQYKASLPVYISRIQPGDLLFFRTNGMFVSHVGLYIGDNRFVHAAGKDQPVKVDNLDSDYWQKHLVGAGTLLN